MSTRLNVVIGLSVAGLAIAIAGGGSVLAGERPVATVTPTPTPAAEAPPVVSSENETRTGGTGPEAPVYHVTTGSLTLIDPLANGNASVGYVVGQGEDCSDKTIVTWAEPDGGESVSLVYDDAGGCRFQSMGYEIEPRRAACAGQTAHVFEVRQRGAVLDRLVYNITVPATNCEDFAE